MTLPLPPCFDLAQTLDCGQAFRWRQRDSCRWEGAALGRSLRLSQSGGALEADCSPEEWARIWAPYFDLEEDYTRIQAELADLSPVLAEAAAFAPGIRILRQDPWEALCTFVLSQNNNIRRIKGLVEAFCRRFGPEIPGSPLRGFPSAERVAALSLEDLAPLRMGYRAPYVLDAARRAAAGEIPFCRILEEEPDFGREQLRKIQGVGPKVAECALLYGFHKTECFPLDVWMKRAMAVLLPGVRPEDFGGNAGLAQQYLFHYSRMHPELF
ncbi:DNA-3-methyladenine glycosylase 2 family protein [Acutalibacter sp. 1XD8-33]|uniref:DNA-3-methyladenine glycosylase family protein n=1 Tax=Acutalibacter sp. 1XD8-33 TaxID=2320081 RepID=UPI000EA2A0AA|nr:DNA glycosylase [Acutalibacter sp. 1XD8-33]RKJ39934.1 DNA-3-methyladenine glycosylase 2 family protein [Acutalibacter sp. 1XD8-33]